MKNTNFNSTSFNSKSFNSRGPVLKFVLGRNIWVAILGIASFILTNTNLFAQQTFDQITVNKNVPLDPNPSSQLMLELRPVNKSYQTIEREIAMLKQLTPINSNEISLDDNKLNNPTLYKIIKEMVEKFVLKAKIEMPKLVLYVGNDNATYNASANTATITHTKTSRKTYKRQIETTVSETVEQKHKLVLGEGLIKLLLWKNYGNKLLAAIIGHEMGHMCDTNKQESKKCEFFADSKAVEFLGKADANNLTQAIDMITLASHMYNILTGNADFLRLNLGDVHQIIKIIVNSMVNQMPELGDLGVCSTHKKFGYVVNKIFQDALKYSLDPKIGMTEKEFLLIYEKMHKACSNLSEYMGEEEEQEISQKYEFIENYTNQIYNHITHPTPLERSTNIEQCIARLA
ncbi:MAG: hypothetical protein WCS92_00855 [Candidatus Babeliales bacterium]|jgi:Zn-dependent protease with chaperone function|nr:MAG: hypothetical protein US22_C0017G0006 [candidate division TM6 bacterium GW2011_GWF2_36_6]